jgi:hypothetical protein
MTTLSALADNSLYEQAHPGNPLESILDDPQQTIPEDRKVDDGTPRFINDVNAESHTSGHKNRQNTTLTVQDPNVHTMLSANRQDRNGYEIYIDPALAFAAPVKRPRGWQQHGPDVLISEADNMKEVITLHDTTHSINAQPMVNFEFGGTETMDEKEPIYTGAGFTVPQLSSNVLTQAQGLSDTFYTDDKGDFKKFSKDAKKNFMKVMTERLLDFR